MKAVITPKKMVFLLFLGDTQRYDWISIKKTQNFLTGF